MKARVTHDGLLRLESENKWERDALYKFMVEGSKHGFYHYSSALSFCSDPASEDCVGWIAVDKDEK
jgi:hypothetical protein